MLPVNKILIPTDFSDPSYTALTTAVELARQFEAELYVVHVVGPLPSLIVTTPAVPPAPALPVSTKVVEYQKQLRNQSEETLKEMVKNTVPDGVTAHAKTMVGEPPYEIVDLAEKEEVDLIVISTHGKRGWKRMLFGSTAEKVVRLAPCPVLTIQQPESENEE